MSIHPQTIEALIEGAVRRRWTESSPNPAIARLIAENENHYLSVLASFLPYTTRLANIPVEAAEHIQTPRWGNTWLSGMDAVSLYGFIADRKPEIYLEIGSGNSTLFAHQAVRDHNLGTRIISIDPQPRANINNICDQVIRKRLEDTDWRPVVASLKPGDIFFYDGSHRCYQNSDVMVFFNEIMPLIPKQVLICIHDIFLPADYPEEWLKRYYSEQYLLACWLLADAGRSIRIELPVWWITKITESAEIRQAADALWQRLPANIQKPGGAFWISKV